MTFSVRNKLIAALIVWARAGFGDTQFTGLHGFPDCRILPRAIHPPALGLEMDAMKPVTVTRRYGGDIQECMGT
jgi:hypothetical protein